jgi:hypothetical protein
MTQELLLYSLKANWDFSLPQRNKTENVLPLSSYPGDTTGSYVVGKGTGT